MYKRQEEGWLVIPASVIVHIEICGIIYTPNHIDRGNGNPHVQGEYQGDENELQLGENPVQLVKLSLAVWSFFTCGYRQICLLYTSLSRGDGSPGTTKSVVGGVVLGPRLGDGDLFIGHVEDFGNDLTCIASGTHSGFRDVAFDDGGGSALSSHQVGDLSLIHIWCTQAFCSSSKVSRTPAVASTTALFSGQRSALKSKNSPRVTSR